MSYTPSATARNKKRTTYNIGKRTGRPIYEPGNMRHIINDAMIPALPPGWRKSANGNWYYEARINRADNTADKGYIVYVDPTTNKQVKVKNTKANRDKLSKMMGNLTSTKKTATKKTAVKTTQPKKKATPRPKIRRTGLRGTRAKAKAKTQAYKRTNQDKEKIPFELVALYKSKTTYLGYVKTLTGKRKSFSVKGTLKSLKFNIDSPTITELSFNRIMDLLTNEGVFKPATLGEKKTVIRHLAANGWGKFNAHRNYLSTIMRDAKRAVAKKEADAKKRAENKKAREERQKKALDYKAPETEKTQAPKVSTQGFKIDEGMAKRAKEAISWSDYAPNSATNAYQHDVEVAAEKVNRHKQHVDKMYWDEIDRKFEVYKKRLAAYYNRYYQLQASMPSWMIAGPANYPVRKAEKKNEQMTKNFEWHTKYVEEYLNKILGVGNGGISSDDKQATQKIDAKLEKLERDQELMKMANAYYRKHKTLDGSGLPKDILDSAKEYMDGWSKDVPFPSFALSNNNANIRRLKERNAQLKKQAASPAMPDVIKSWGTIVRNKDENRLQLLFNAVPDADTRTLLKSNGFKWSPKNKAWQRMLNHNSEYVLDNFILPKLGD